MSHQQLVSLEHFAAATETVLPCFHVAKFTRHCYAHAPFRHICVQANIDKYQFYYLASFVIQFVICTFSCAVISLLLTNLNTTPAVRD